MIIMVTITITTIRSSSSSSGTEVKVRPLVCPPSTHHATSHPVHARREEESEGAAKQEPCDVGERCASEGVVCFAFMRVDETTTAMAIGGLPTYIFASVCAVEMILRR